jgi:Fe2+ or Zn2+ uptake regulation protein
MKDKELLLKAIDNYDVYTPKQREILKTLIGISVNDIAIITPRELTKLLNTTKATVYYSLTRLKEDEIIINQNGEKERFSIHRLNNTKLDDILTVYKRKTEYFKKNI